LIEIEPRVEAVMMAGQVQYHVEPAFSTSFAPDSSKSRAPSDLCRERGK